ncbi:hypothetical protein BDV29DRAFT_116981 [Aspergillus leporis]|uniref:Uncharacterized protein n=1 Tax=Aspergillus leporis TaxID=41062 RepID=A0A5N5X5H7_9EURO|nr:hypothetical protein BDV29DRAFT_116981 [Aspergillus leporis]
MRGGCVQCLSIPGYPLIPVVSFYQRSWCMDLALYHGCSRFLSWLWFTEVIVNANLEAIATHRGITRPPYFFHDWPCFVSLCATRYSLSVVVF